MRRLLRTSHPVIWLIVWAALATATPVAQSADEAGESVYQRAAVAADHPLASEVGVEVLKKGGNVVDAAAAVGFALSVLRPASAGIGGGGFMVIWDSQTERAIVLDYRERAPLKATADLFADDAKRPDDEDTGLPKRSVRGPLAAAVPNHVAGLCYAVEKFGRLPIADVIAPAIRFARDGVRADAHHVTTLKSALRTWNRWPADFRQRFAEFHKSYLHDGRDMQVGDRVTSPQLPALEQIAARGAAGFYSGPVRDALVSMSQSQGGLYAEADFRDVRPVVREPLRMNYHAHEIITMPPPSSGGIALLATLQILDEIARRPGYSHVAEKFDASDPGTAHVLTEAFKHVFADRAEFLGDADFAPVPVAKLISREHARELADRIDLSRTLPVKSYGRFAPLSDSGTTHFSVIDAEGNAVACTETINTEYGSWVVEPRFGILLNNEMDDFAALPGQPNAFGLIQSAANRVEPRKKPLSSMTPTLVVKDGKAVYALGASGGPRIITATTQVLLSMLRRGQSPVNAVQNPRLHHQWLPNVLDVEPRFVRDLTGPLGKLGHVVKERSSNAVTQAVSRSADGLRGSSDPRKGGRAAGW